MKNELIEKLHARADAKLHSFYLGKIGCLFDICGGHGQQPGDLSNISEINKAIKSLHSQIRDDKTPWHGTVFELAGLILKAKLIKKYRKAEVDAFIAKVDKMINVLDDIDNE